MKISDEFKEKTKNIAAKVADIAPKILTPETMRTFNYTIKPRPSIYEGSKDGVVYVCSHDTKNGKRKLTKHYGTFVKAEIANKYHFEFQTHGNMDIYAGIFVAHDGDIFHYKKRYNVKDPGVYFYNIVWLENEDDELASKIFMDHCKEEFENAKKKYEEDTKFFEENSFTF